MRSAPNPSTGDPARAYHPGGVSRRQRGVAAAPPLGAGEETLAYLIDASNLGGLLGGARGARDAQAVLAFLAPWARGRGTVVVVFDGPPRPEIARRYGPLEVRFSGARAADDRMVEVVAADPAAWIVVTQDRELARRCRDAGAKVESAAALAGRVSRPHPRAARGARPATAPDKPPAHAEEREHWRKVFADEEE